ncbi:SPBc2 prophage-derived glycosyltransferase SunS [Ruminiclostridium hungatei]|uniref:SPBc2 prophage-derived glycosyltransferase SunS n=1 Tax=Ruminiclostridium hungatei TaxID=48256 RepID=A0A1V4SE29_RUMHU|nr:glycosyltransferase [Ruminiclostridium hungatei]OPX42182.1 SPBc2 prophage-derived glycosyltransferase SunS [Ruminiclostridium hungatei]
MITVSLCMIVKNEEQVLARCLDSISSEVDEIIIMDTGSSDETKSIARRYTNMIYDFEWIDDFAAARNAAFAKANMDYILWMDADDVFEADQLNKFAELKKSLNPDVDSVSMNYILSSDEYGNIQFKVRRNRLVKRANNFRWIGAVHEYLEVYGNTLQSDISVTHKSLSHDGDRNLNIYEKRLARGEEFSPRDLYYFANELFDHRMYPRAINLYEQFLSGDKGWVEDNISSCSKLADCYHYMENYESELQSVLRSFRYSSPRPEFCCRLGYYFLQKNNVLSATFWYKTAVQEQSEETWFSNPTYSTWLPHLQLCVCYDRIGNHKLAYLHSEVARQYRPDDQRILSCQQYLKSILNSNEQQ